MDAKLCLKPCPFCGSAGELAEDEGRTTSKHYTADCCCSNCTYVRSPTGYGTTKEQAKEAAIAAWNTRIPLAAPSPEVDDIELIRKITFAMEKYEQETYDTPPLERPENDEYYTDGEAKSIIEAIRPYLAPQGAVRVNLKKCAEALRHKNYQPYLATDAEQADAKAVILSLKKQNPDKEFQDVD